MKSLHTLSLYYRTIKHLKFVQIFNRVYRSLGLPRFISNKILIKSSYIFPCYQMFFSENDLSSDTFTFLNSSRNLNFPKDWNNEEIPLLWTYNLHYFNDLLASNIKLKYKKTHIKNWITDNPRNYKGPGWDPYTLSLRIVNWIKFFSNENSYSEMEIKSLLEQIRHLNKSIEYHLLGNHILENSKALIFAGLFFQGDEPDKWLNKGIKILKKEINEQILDDGAHFELSPSYHCLMLDLFLEIYELTLTSSEQNQGALFNCRNILESTIKKMYFWLINIVHPDGEIPYFNDSAVGISKEPSYYVNKSLKLLPDLIKCDKNEVIFFKDSGYYKIIKDNFFIFFDCGDIGPLYQPGHGHADTLSFELSYLKYRLFINLGTSLYEPCPRRAYERGTKSHTTLEVEDRDSSEVWSSFRVGSRAKVLKTNMKESSDAIEVYGEHDGYSFLNKKLIHKREICISKDNIIINDELNVGEFKGCVRFHLHPNIKIESNLQNKSGSFIMPDGKKFLWKAKCDHVEIKQSKYASEFGILKNTKTLVLSDTKFKKSSLIINI